MAAAPRRLGKYRLLRQLAVGGMAEIYEAVAEGFGDFAKRVVIKRLLPQHARELDVLTMFVDEARLLARLRHPNIAEVYDVGHDGQDFYFALEYVEGADLRELLRAREGRPLPLAQALYIVASLADGLEHAHTLTDEAGRPLGIVHRDVSPSNVLIATDGAVKLIDFGVAKWTAQRSETRHGTLKGKVNYMSPEQCRAEALDGRSDVFALGVLLYELTTGVRPFASDSDFEVLSAITAGRFRPPSALVSDYPSALAQLVLQALALEPSGRFASAGAFAAAVRSYADGAGLSLSPGALGHEARAQVALRAAAVPIALDPEGQAPVADDRTLTAAPTAPVPRETVVVAGPSGPRRGRRALAALAALGVAGVGLWMTRGEEPPRTARPPLAAPPPAPMAHGKVEPARPREEPTRSPQSAREGSQRAPAATNATKRGPAAARPDGARPAPPGAPTTSVTAPPPAESERDRTAPVTATPTVWDPDSPIPP